MERMCDKCTVAGCLLDPMGKACESARHQYCPDVQPTNADWLDHCLGLDEAFTASCLLRMIQEICKDGARPTEAAICAYLKAPHEES